MASISTVTSSTTTVLPEVVESTNTGQTTGTGSGQSAPAFQETLTTQGRIFALGLGAPRNHGDIEALFAEVATRFGVESAKATDFAEAAEDAKRSTALRAAAGNLALFAGLAAMIKEAQDSIKEKQLEIKQLTAEIDTKNAEKAALEDQYAEYRAEWNQNAETQLSNAGKIALLGTKLSGVEIAKAFACIDSSSDACRDLTAEANSLNSQIDALEEENATLFDRNLELDGLMFDLAIQISGLSFEILGLEIDRGLAELSIELSEGEINFAQGLLDAFAVVFIPFSVDLALRTMGEVGRASFEITPDQLGLDKAVGDAANNIADQAQRMGEIENARKAFAQMPADDPATLAAIKDFLAGKGLPGGVEPEERIEAGAILELLSALRQMVSNGVPPASDGKPSAVTGPNGSPSTTDQVLEALQENLPPGLGNPEKVTSEAAGLAGALALLQGILTQVAGGEASQGTQVPGPTGRLNLAI